MSTDQSLGFTRARDLLVVALIAGVAGYALIRWNYGRMPALPRLAGLAAALIGAAEALYGWGLRARIQDAARVRSERYHLENPDQVTDSAMRLRPVAPLSAARALLTAKATSLAGAAFGGIWLGLLVYVVPVSSSVTAAQDDRTTAIIGVVGAVVMVCGALFLEHCCRTPPTRRRSPSDR